MLLELNTFEEFDTFLLSGLVAPLAVDTSKM